MSQQSATRCSVKEGNLGVPTRRTRKTVWVTIASPAKSMRTASTPDTWNVSHRPVVHGLLSKGLGVHRGTCKEHAASSERVQGSYPQTRHDPLHPISVHI